MRLLSIGCFAFSVRLVVMRYPKPTAKPVALTPITSVGGELGFLVAVASVRAGAGLAAARQVLAAARQEVNIVERQMERANE